MPSGLLEKYDEMQRRPFGTNSSLSNNSLYGAPSQARDDAYQFKRQGEAYSRALRLLDRKARRGDADSALKAIGLRDRAMEDGFTPGGIASREVGDDRTIGFLRSQDQRAKDAETANSLIRSEMEGFQDPAPPAPPASPTSQADSPKAGYGTPIGQGASNADSPKAGYGTPVNPQQNAETEQWAKNSNATYLADRASRDKRRGGFRGILQRLKDSPAARYLANY